MCHHHKEIFSSEKSVLIHAQKINWSKNFYLHISNSEKNKYVQISLRLDFLSNLNFARSSHYLQLNFFIDAFFKKKKTLENDWLNYLTKNNDLRKTPIRETSLNI